MNNRSPLVSVLMTAYNREKFIAQAIESVLQSTYKNFELIIVDDGSKDSTLQIANNYSKKDNRIIIHQNSINLGDYNNRNKAASLAKGELLKYLDSDDVIYPSSIEILVNYYLIYPNVGFIFSDCFIQDNEAPFPILYSPHEAYKINFLKTHLFYAGPGGTIIPTKVFNEIGGFSGKRHLGDTELWLKISLKYPILKIQASLIWWRIHENQEASLEQTNLEMIGNRYSLMKQYIAESPLTKEEQILSKNIIDKNFARQILKLLFIDLKISQANSLLKSTNFKIYKLLRAFDISNKVKTILKRNNL